MHENHKNLNFCRFAGFESTVGSAHNIVHFPRVSAQKAWVDHRSAHNIVQLVTGQRMEAWVDHRSAHNIVQLVTGQRMETWVDHRVGAWSFHFPTGQRTPTYGRRILLCFSVCPKLQAMSRRIDLLWSTVRAQIQFLSISHSVWKAVKWVGWFVTINRSLVTCINQHLTNWFKCTKNKKKWNRCPRFFIFIFNISQHINYTQPFLKCFVIG
jgi:hypothetical protein